MLQLAIEIGADNVRAAVKKGRECSIAPLGPVGSPDLCPPIGLLMADGYIFGAAAKLNAVSRPDKTIFLSDYLQPGMIDKNAMTAFISHVCGRVASVFNEPVADIAFVTPPCRHNPSLQRFVNECITASGRTPMAAMDFPLAFVQANCNVAQGDKICVIDMRDCPAYAAVVARTAHSYGTLGSVEFPDFSIMDCENFLEEKIEKYQLESLPAPDSTMMAWFQSDVASSLTRCGLTDLLAGNDAVMPVPFSSCDLKVAQTEFQEFLAPNADRIWSQFHSLLQNLSTPASQITEVVMLGGLFQSEFIADRIKKCFLGYGGNPKFSVLAEAEDDWAFCLSSLKMNFQSSGCALRL